MITITIDARKFRIARNLAVAGLAAALLAGTPASGVSQDLGAAGGNDIERFCSNIADAARDRRYALQRDELETLRADIDVRIALLEEKRAEYEEWLSRREEFLARAEDSLVEIYARMRPDAAAERLAGVSTDLAAGILMKINSRQAGTILNEMDAASAATLTGIIASAARKKDPT
jgi:flagellar motility protein MotE (MotC chaperone)